MDDNGVPSTTMIYARAGGAFRKLEMRLEDLPKCGNSVHGLLGCIVIIVCHVNSEVSILRPPNTVEKSRLRSVIEVDIKSGWVGSDSQPRLEIEAEDEVGPNALWTVRARERRRWR